MYAYSSTSQQSQGYHLASTTMLTFQRSRNRLEVRCPAMLAGAAYLSEALIHNLSEAGCLVECEHTILAGSCITARLLLPDQAPALVIEVAAIRWVRQHHFGIEFLRTPAPDHSRLNRFLSSYRR